MNIAKRAFLNHLNTNKTQNQTSLEKILLAISGGTLGASTTFITVNKGISFIHTEWLHAAWGSFSLSLLSLLFSYLFLFIYIEDMQEKLEKISEEFIPEEGIKKLEAKWALGCLEFSNMLSLTLTIGGLISLSVFGFFNIP